MSVGLFNPIKFLNSIDQWRIEKFETEIWLYCEVTSIEKVRKVESIKVCRNIFLIIYCKIVTLDAVQYITPPINYSYRSDHHSYVFSLIPLSSDEPRLSPSWQYRYSRQLPLRRRNSASQGSTASVEKRNIISILMSFICYILYLLCYLFSLTWWSGQGPERRKLFVSLWILFFRRFLKLILVVLMEQILVLESPLFLLLYFSHFFV